MVLHNIFRFNLNKSRSLEPKFHFLFTYPGSITQHICFLKKNQNVKSLLHIAYWFCPFLTLMNSVGIEKIFLVLGIPYDLDFHN